MAVLGVTALVVALLGSIPATAAVAPVGNGFVVTAGDISFILKQIKIAEVHTQSLTPANPCGTLLAQPGDAFPDKYQVPDAITSYGLRTVDGSCNNLKNSKTPAPGQPSGPLAGNPDSNQFGGADQTFPRLTSPVFKAGEAPPPGFPASSAPFPGQQPGSYQQTQPGNLVYDSQPRVASNLIVDQTSTNPAAVAASGHPQRSQSTKATAVPCTTDPDPTAVPQVDGVPLGCTPSHKTLFIPNITTDTGLSPPYNSWFTFFGQFFDHGVDQTVKSGGTVFVPLRADDPLRTVGPDGIAGTNCGTPTAKNCDEVPASQAFMPLTRAQNQPGPDGVLGTADDVQDANNTDTPWVDQSQTYTSHASHQVFLREYGLVNGRPQGTGKLLDGLAAGQTYSGSPDDTTGMSTWAAVKLQAKDKLGLLLQDKDVTNIPTILTDPYGEFIPGPARGLPQYVTKTGLVEGDIANPVAVPANVEYFDTPFLTDIAHNADPSPVDTNHDGIPDTAPTPDADNVPNADFANQPAGTYDDEGLNAHFSCGDGRCNENIALSAVHQIFHSEHNRLVDDIKGTLGQAGNEALKADFEEVTADPDDPHPFTVGDRYFQAARFVTEMEYQHLVFEEFARKVQPAVRPFHVYSPDINPAIDAEFAAAVYRFGHSMLDDNVARQNEVPVAGSTTGAVTKKDNSLPLLDAFLNPPQYFNNGSGGFYTPEQAAGAIIMGSSDQVGNEIDEFVTETLRNNLLGLPLDLPSINMARARDVGIKSLNGVRRDLFGQTNDGQLAPYTSWSDYGQHLKHPESLINFVAAYGTHPTVRDSGPDGILGNGDDVTTIAAKRAAARAIVDPLPAQAGPDGVFGTADDIPADVPPTDAAAFMFGTGTWANDANGITTTGLDNVDLWVGGLAELTNQNGGMLGSTFNYVFQTQLEKLQDGDRLYYLARTPGLNLRTQLEGNSFAELIQRNTDGTHTLKADAFATSDCKFELSQLDGTAAAFATSGATVTDDPNSACDESKLLLRKPDGTIQYRATNTVDPPGINGQSVYNGTAIADRVFGGVDNDTIWGNDGNDVIEGNNGDDTVLGGNGDDIITDLNGADVPKGGPGNDAINAGPGDDIIMGNEGQDFIDGGANDNETFAGPGNDFIIAGQGADAVFGDGGDDWIQGGTGQDLLQGDHGAPFFDDPGEAAPGNDIFIGQPGENDYDAEGGDDIMAQNAAIDRNAGAGGYDWAIHQYDTVGADDDMLINNFLIGLPIQVVVNRDRWQETEADSGSNFDDKMRGTSDERITGPAGFIGCDALDQAGVDRINGLNALVNTFPTKLADVVAASTAKFCPLTGSGPTKDGVWAEGNILLGGGGNDVIEGRENNDIIDGDHSLNVRISVHALNADGTLGAETGSTDLMENVAKAGTFGDGTAGMTLQQAVMAGKVDPGQLVAVRDILAPNGSAMGPSADLKLASDCPTPDPVSHMVVPTSLTKNCDTAVYSAAPDQYTVVKNTDGSVTVTANGSVLGVPFDKTDGIDTLWNVENLRFCTGNDPVTKLCNAFQDVAAPTTTGGGTALAAPTAVLAGTTATVSFTAPAAAGTTFRVTAIPSVAGGPTVPPVDGPASPILVAGLPAGTFTFTVAAVVGGVPGPASAASNSVTVVTAPPAATAPTAAPVIGTAVRGNAQATVSWSAVAVAGNGGSPITGYVVQVIQGATTRNVSVGNVTTTTVTGLTNGLSYTFTVAAVNVVGTGPKSAASNAVTPAAAATAPSVPANVVATRGNAQVSLSWTVNNGGSAITSSNVQVRNNATGVLVQNITITGTATSRVVTALTNGTTYNFRVRATNAIGTSALSGAVTATPATTPGAPVIGTAAAGAAAGAPINATARWTPPANTGGSVITGYKVTALRMSAAGAVLGTTVSAVQAATARSLVMTLPQTGNYRFTVQAVNAVGDSAQSARSNLVAGR